MVKIRSSSGGFVTVDLIGVEEVRTRLKKLGMNISNENNDQLIKNATLLAREVQESIIGRRAEPKSVDTGKFANSITVKKKSKDEIAVEPKLLNYPNGVTTIDVSTWLEYGTKRITPRRHFQNSAKRVKPQIIDNFKQAVKKQADKF